MVEKWERIISGGRKSIILLEGSQALPACPFDKDTMRLLFTNSVRNSNKTHRVSITKINWLMLCREIIAVYTENQAKPIK
jgi:hypothetical protein